MFIVFLFIRDYNKKKAVIRSHGYKPQARSCSLYILVSDKHRVRGSYVFLVVVMAHNLHIVETERQSNTLVRGSDEAQCVQGKLKLRAHTNKDAAFGLYPVLPAELKS